MLSLATFVQQLKRRTKYGDPSNVSDQLTADIVYYINQRKGRIWRRYAWAWSFDEYTLALVAGTINYTLDAAVGDIVAIDNGFGDYLKKRTLKRYLSWNKEASGTDAAVGHPTDYVRMGLDATKAIKIKLWPAPVEAANRAYWGKKRLTRYTVADLATNTDLDLPEEMLDVLEAGVVADIYEAQGKPEWVTKNTYFQGELERMVKEETVEIDDDNVSDVSDYQRFHKRMRGGTTVT